MPFVKLVSIALAFSWVKKGSVSQTVYLKQIYYLPEQKKLSKLCKNNGIEIFVVVNNFLSIFINVLL